jgi:hypothetical protein
MHRAGILDARGLPCKEKVVDRDAELFVQVTGLAHTVKGVGTKRVLV